MMILNESGRDDLLLPFLEILKSRGIDCKLGVLKRYLLKHFVEDGNFRNLSLGSNFYLAGVARYYFNGDLTQNKNLAVFDETNQTKDIWNEDICKRLNALILILRNSVVDSVGETFEQPEDFGDLPIAKLLRKYGAKINKELGIVTTKKEKVDTLNRSESVGNGYTFDIIYSQAEASKYYKPTQPGAWCITYATQHYNYYKNHLGIHYVIFKKDGWENVPRQKGPDWTPQKPQDEYGCSLIALLQSNTNGEPVYITSRWNHGWETGTACEADHAFTKEEFFAKTGVNDADLQRIFAIWQKDKSVHSSRTAGQNSEERARKLYNLRDLKYRQMRINGGENPDTVMVTIPRDMTDKAEIQMYIERHKFAMVGNGKPNKSIINYTIEIEGEEYHVLVDKGRILFESLVPSTEYWRMDSWRATYDYTDRMSSDNTRRVSNCEWLHNMIVIRLSGDKYKLYDIRRHKFLDVGGVTTFKYIDNTRHWNREGAVFYELKLTNRQIALVDINTNTPLKLPNGQYWFEELKYEGKSNYYGREVKPGLVGSNATYLTIIYDSSAKEAFFYNMSTKRFENLDISDFNNIQELSVKSGGLNDPTIMKVVNDGYPDYNRQGFIFKDGKKMAFGDIEEFRSIRVSGGYAFITLSGKNLPQDTNTSAPGVDMFGEKTICWIENEQSFITLNGEPFRFAGVELDRNVRSSAEAKILFLRRDFNTLSEYYDNSKYIYSLFSTQNNAFLVNPDTKDITFNLGFRGYYHKNEEVIEIRDVNRISSGDNYVAEPVLKTYQVSNLIQQGYLKSAIVPNSAPLHFVEKDNEGQEQVGEPMAATVNERVEYNMNDIKEMVLEVLNKIKKKK